MEVFAATNAEEGMTAVVTLCDKGYAVRLRDDASGCYVPTLYTFPLLSAATAKANFLVGIK